MVRPGLVVSADLRLGSIVDEEPRLIGDDGFANEGLMDIEQLTAGRFDRSQAACGRSKLEKSISTISYDSSLTYCFRSVSANPERIFPTPTE
jgi:hypothetical protein